MTPRAVSPARASSLAGLLSDARRAWPFACATATDRMPVLSTLLWRVETPRRAGPEPGPAGFCPAFRYRCPTRYQLPRALPTAPFEAGLGQGRRIQEGRRSGEV